MCSWWSRAASAGGPACVHDDSTIFVSDVLAPQYVTAGNGVRLHGRSHAAHLASGALDVGLTSSTRPEFLVGNQIVPRGDPNQPQTETSFVLIEGGGRPDRGLHGQPAQHVHAAGGRHDSALFGHDAGVRLGRGLKIIDSDTAQATSSHRRTPCRSSRTSDSSATRWAATSVESNEFGFPDRDLPTAASSASRCGAETTSCRRPTARSAARRPAASTSVPCVLGQDLVVDCSACQRKAFCSQNEVTVSTVVDAGGGG